MSEKHSIPPSPNDWRNMLELTQEQLEYTYSTFPGFDIRAVRLLSNAIEQVRSERNKAQTDPLTQIGNRASIEAWSSEHYQPSERDYIAIAFDLNFFKGLNDTFGHGAGDRALVAFSEKLLATFRFRPRENTDEDARSKYYSPDGLFVRPGGDEFVVVLPIESDTDVAKITETLDGRMHEQLVVQREDLGDVLNPDFIDKFVPVTVRYSVAVSDGDMSFEELLAEADEGLKKEPSSR